MPDENALEASRVEYARFDELEQTSFVLSASGLECDCGEVLRGKDARGGSVYVLDQRFFQRFFHERGSRWQELDRPASDDDVFALIRAATCCQIIVYAFRIGYKTAGSRFNNDKNVDIKRCDRLQIKRRPHRTTDGVRLYHAVSLHLVDDGDDFFDVHVPNISRGEGRIQFIEQCGQLCTEKLMRLAQAAALIEW